MLVTFLELPDAPVDLLLGKSLFHRQPLLSAMIVLAWFAAMQWSVLAQPHFLCVTLPLSPFSS